MTPAYIRPTAEVRRVLKRIRRYRRRLLSERRPRKRLAHRYKIFELSAHVWRLNRESE